MKEPIIVVAVVAVLAVCLYFGHLEQQEQEKYIQDWAVQNEQKVIELTITTFDNGPFWLVNREDGDDVWFLESYDLNQKRNRKSYFLFPIFGSNKHEFAN